MSFLRVGHRGAAGTRPELTRAAFERAIGIGVDMIELDVQLTRDRQLVVLHDRELGRTVAGQGAVRDYTLDDLRARDAGTWFGPEYGGERVLALAEVLDLTRGRAELNVEVKSPAPDWDDTAAALDRLLVAADRVEATIVSSFSMGALAAVRRTTPQARLGVLWQAFPPPQQQGATTEIDLSAAWAAAADLGASAFHPFWGMIDERVVRDAHDRGLGVITWTVNDPADMRRLVALGVDGLISDFPERFDALG